MNGLNMEVSAQRSNMRTNQEDERIELDELLHTTTTKNDSDEAESTPVVEVPSTTEVDLESDVQKVLDGGDADDQSCCSCGK